MVGLVGWYRRSLRLGSLPAYVVPAVVALLWAISAFAARNDAGEALWLLER